MVIPDFVTPVETAFAKSTCRARLVSGLATFIANNIIIIIYFYEKIVKRLLRQAVYSLWYDSMLVVSCMLFYFITILCTICVFYSV